MSGLWPCHSLPRLIGFRLSPQRKGNDYKQINRVGLHGGWPAPTAWIPCDRGGDWECVKVVGLKTGTFKARMFTATVRQGWWRLHWALCGCGFRVSLKFTRLFTYSAWTTDRPEKEQNLYFSSLFCVIVSPFQDGPKNTRMLQMPWRWVKMAAFHLLK